MARKERRDREDKVERRWRERLWLCSVAILSYLNRRSTVQCMFLTTFEMRKAGEAKTESKESCQEALIEAQGSRVFLAVPGGDFGVKGG